MPAFPREERLKEKLLIARLFAKGKHLAEFPIRLLWVEEEGESMSGLKVLFSVPKKKVRKAVDRNKIKRKMREVYRQNRTELKNMLTDRKKGLVIGFVFMGTTTTPATETESKIILTLRRLQELNVKTV